MRYEKSREKVKYNCGLHFRCIKTKEEKEKSKKKLNKKMSEYVVQKGD